MGTEARHELETARGPLWLREQPGAEAPGARTWATVDLSMVRHNVAVVRRLVGPSVAVGAVVKANAYGHGAVAVARAAVDGGASALVVANAEEGIELRSAGFEVPVIIAGASLPSDAEAIVREGLSACLAPPQMLEALRAEARRQGKRAPVHVMADLGMRRDGVTWDEAIALLDGLADSPELELEGLASHFPTADDPDTSLSRRQTGQFGKLIEAARDRGLHPRYCHLSNTAGLLRLPEAHFDLVRVGILLYGMASSPSLEGAADWRPVLSWHSTVVCLRRVPAGAGVGYGHTYHTPRPTVLATVPVGYHDGFVRADSDNADVLVRGRRAPVVGRVSMDYATVDVGGVPGVGLGDVVTLIGRDGDERIRAEELAERRGTIPYEVTCSIGQRVRRVYVDTEGTA